MDVNSLAIKNQELIAAADIKLSREDLAQMDAIGRTVTDHLDDNPVLWKF